VCDNKRLGSVDGAKLYSRHATRHLDSRVWGLTIAGDDIPQEIREPPAYISFCRRNYISSGILKKKERNAK
jgi:hypothetical protein